MKPEIRKAKASDASVIARLEYEIFPDAWTEEDILKFLSSETDMSYVLVLRGEVVAYLIGSKIPPESEIYRLATDVRYRRLGLAKKLTDFVFDAQKCITDCYLEVRESNAPAINLYTGCGFLKISERKNYYKNPCENGIIMHRENKEDKK